MQIRGVKPLSLLVLLSLVLMISCSKSNKSSSSNNDGSDPDVVAKKVVPVAKIKVSKDIITNLLTLDGSESYDPEGSEIAEYDWEQVDGTTVVIDDLSSSQISFELPNVNGTIIFQLAVTDEDGDKSIPAEALVSIFDGEVTEVEVLVYVQNAAFVSETLGDDSNAGTWNEPVATITKGIEAAVANSYDTVYVMNGTYVEKVDLTLSDSLNIVGGVDSFSEDGRHVYSGVVSTVIEAPTGTDCGIIVSDSHNVDISRLNIQGGDECSLRIENSTNISVDMVTVTTLASLGNDCIDIEIVNSNEINLSGIKLSNNGSCTNYTGIDILESYAIELGASGSQNIVTLNSGGSESSLRAINIDNSENVGINFLSIVGDGVNLDDTKNVSGVNILDSNKISFKNSLMNISGANVVSGVSLQCTNAPSVIDVSNVDFILSDTKTKLNGIMANCPLGDIKVDKSKFILASRDNVISSVYGIEVTSITAPLNFLIQNSAIVMKAAPINDLAEKIGIRLVNIGDSSDIGIYYNTFIITGKDGELHGLYHNQDNAKFEIVGNVGVVFGANADNAFLSLHENCATNECISVLQTNMFNQRYFFRTLPIIHYRDNTIEAMNTVNECTSASPPAKCTDPSVTYVREGNVILMQPIPVDLFDEYGRLMSGYQGLSKDLGAYVPGIIEDVDDISRNSNPDIGAYEY